MNKPVVEPSKINICIVAPNKNVYSETFIKQHIEFLDGNIFPVYGSWLPEFTAENTRITDYYYNNHVARKVFKWFVKVLPAGLYNRMPEHVKGYPYSERFLKIAFKQYLVDNKIQIVIAEFFAKGFVIMDVCKELKIPFVVHTHGGGDIMSNKVQYNYKKYFTDLFESVSKVIVVDGFSLNSLVSLGLNREKISHIKNGIDLSLFKKSVPSVNRKIFFGVGRFTDQKAPYLTILAFEKVLFKHKDAVLYLAGQGELLDCCKQLVKALKINQSVFFPGVISPLEVAAFMQKSRAFVQHSVHTSLGESEGTPVAVLEAMACGLPVISTFHNGIEEVIEHGENGLLTPEHDIELMSSYMINVIEDSALADRIGSNARKTIEKEYTREIIIDKLNGVVRSIIK